MKLVLPILTFVLILFCLYVLSLMGRRGRTDKELSSVRYAHRGLHKKPEIPENSLAAFSRAVEKGYGIELDVHLMSDGSLAVIHDESLLRTAGADISVESLTLNELSNYRLEGGDEKIPTFKETLELIGGRVPLIIELKAVNNAPSLCTAVCRELENYNGRYCIESFDPRCLMWFRKNRPDVVRGQLSCDFFKDKGTKLPLILKILLTNLCLNFLTQPDFVAYKFEDRGGLSFKIATKFWKISAFSWTIKSKENLIQSEKENMTPIFEQIEP